MNVVELLYKLRMIANVEIVVALLPEMVGVSDQTPRHSLLQRFEGVGERALLLETRDIPTQAKTGLESGTVDCGLAEEKVNVLGHHDVCVDAKVEVAAHALKGVLKYSSACVGREQGTALIAREGYEMALPGVVITLKAPRHEVRVACWNIPTQGKRGLEWGTLFQNGMSVEETHSSQNQA